MDPTDIGGRELYAKAAFIAQCLYSYCVLPDNGLRLRKTASISPGTSLKHREANKAFQWQIKYVRTKNFFTLAACREGIKMLLEKPQVEVPLVGLSMDAWITNQAKVGLETLPAGPYQFWFQLSFRRLPAIKDHGLGRDPGDRGQARIFGGAVVVPTIFPNVSFHISIRKIRMNMIGDIATL